MKIIVDDGVYVQKRDVLYLKQAERLTASFIKTYPDAFKKITSDTVFEPEFVLFQGEEAKQYFEKQEDILSLDTYLHLSSTDLSLLLEKHEENPYLRKSYTELLLEKEGICALPYPVLGKTLRKTYKEKGTTYFFYESDIPHLFFFQKEGERPFSSTLELPYTFQIQCEQFLQRKFETKPFLGGRTKEGSKIFLLQGYHVKRKEVGKSFYKKR